jgi:hypothetical protein
MPDSWGRPFLGVVALKQKLSCWFDTRSVILFGSISILFSELALDQHRNRWRESIESLSLPQGVLFLNFNVRDLRAWKAWFSDNG